MKRVIFIMGVSGCGKNMIGKLLAQEFDIPFFDGDNYHPKNNIAKMSRGQALNDSDSQNWLESLNHLAKKEVVKNNCVVTCSAFVNSLQKPRRYNVDGECW